MIAALYVWPNGPYYDREGIDPWGPPRDACDYAGPYPVIAHPPCGPWGRFKNVCKESDGGRFKHALECVREYGGILEHPSGSTAWYRFMLPHPRCGDQMDLHGGRSIAINQFDFGHLALKPTWLYGVNVQWPELPAKRIETPRRTKWLSRRQRSITPRPLIDWMVSAIEATPKGVPRYLVGAAARQR